MGKCYFCSMEKTSLLERIQEEQAQARELLLQVRRLIVKLRRSSGYVFYWAKKSLPDILDEERIEEKVDIHSTDIYDLRVLMGFEQQLSALLQEGKEPSWNYLAALRRVIKKLKILLEKGEKEKEKRRRKKEKELYG